MAAWRAWRPEFALSHGGDPVLSWMAGNVQTEMDPAGNVKPSKAKSYQKIEGIVALIIALERAVHAEPPSPPASR